MQQTRIPIRSIPFAEALLKQAGSNEVLERLAALTTGYTPDAACEQQEATYYDYPVLKAPVWSWEIVWYFFMGGLAAGCYILATIASLFGGPEDRAVKRAGYYLALLAVLPCPILLIKDLGQPKRFLHMLRVFKVKSPMSMGVWGLLGFSLFSSLTAITQAAQDGVLGAWWGPRTIARIPQKLLTLPGAVFGIFLGSYTGVLLAATSVPLWSRSKLLGAVFVSSALSTSAALISCVLHLVSAPASTLHKLEQFEWLAMIVEGIGLLAFLRSSGRAARSLVGTGPDEHGRTFWRYMFGGGLALPWLLQSLLLVRKNPRRRKSNVGFFISLLALIGGYFLRHTLVNAGRSSSRNARITLWNARR
ncbi:MAG TPA: NrfD/PsrC family molybdoenzyme membrane anchor subunit [Ktedonobacteraceae bacterium]|nr:NrfD/PsrC family molybdoenzyme membrane anchor subunit [Ktedonobacteraceae bacterium]